MANDFDKAASILEAIAHEVDHFSEAEIREVGEFAVNLIVLRTKQGKDVTGQPFVKYSPAYASERATSGYSTTPDLARTGHMLGAIEATPEYDGAVLKFSNFREALKGAVQDGGSPKKNIPARPFFDITKESEMAALDEILGGRMMTRIEKHSK